MDPGQVVWLPGSGFNKGDEDLACANTYGWAYASCGDQPDDGGTLVYCCHI